MRSRGRFVWAFPLLALFVYASFAVDSNLSGVRRFLEGNEEKVQEASSTEPKLNDTKHQREQGGARLRLGETSRVRPIIYTFFQPMRIGNTIPNDQNKLLLAWIELWSKAGWEPKVLTLRDAKNHPDYEYYSDIIVNSESVWKLKEGSYNHLCFVRWLAMATQSTGGWMSDYDTVPLGITVNAGLHLPNNGEFTSYTKHVPALMSGTHEEWERMAHTILEQAITVQPEKLPMRNFYSDMYALLHVYQRDPSILHYGVKGTKGFVTMKGEKILRKDFYVDCNYLKQKGVIAVHFSHAAIRAANTSGNLTIPKGKSESDRQYFARTFTKKWMDQCKPNLNEITGKAQSIRE